MDDSDTGTRRETEAELRMTRVKALSSQDLVAVLTYLLARHPDTFPAMLDDALSSVSPKPGGGQ
jgi:hypothetical protein